MNRVVQGEGEGVHAGGEVVLGVADGPGVAGEGGRVQLPLLRLGLRLPEHLRPPVLLADHVGGQLPGHITVGAARIDVPALTGPLLRYCLG